jgi:hypothetical protein
MVVHVRNAVSLQHLSILGPKDPGITDLDGIFELVREFAEKTIQSGTELTN